jgi:aryl-alcohol dehydrogenase-like predicted oxidoreductase
MLNFGPSSLRTRTDLKMQKRKLGQEGLEVSAIGLACMGLNFHRGTDMGRVDAVAFLR